MNAEAVWWESIRLPSRLFYIIGIAALLILVAESVLNMAGMNKDESEPGGLSVRKMNTRGLGINWKAVAVRAGTVFFLGFGWGGAIALDWFGKPPAAVGIGVVAGISLVAALLFLTVLFAQANAGRTRDMHYTIGTVGVVCKELPPNQSGIGQIEVMVGGRTGLFNACSKERDPIGVHQRVRVVELVGNNVLLVERTP